MFAGNVMECPAANKVAMLRCECFVRAAAGLNRGRCESRLLYFTPPAPSLRQRVSRVATAHCASVIVGT